MTDADEGEKASPEVLRGTSALPLQNTNTPWKLGGAGAPASTEARGTDAKSGFQKGHKDGVPVPAPDSRTGGPSPFKGLGGK
jgi:hypothetical protein